MLSIAAVRAVLARDERDARYWAIRWQYLKGDGFYDALLRTAAHADDDNLHRLSLGFPKLAEAVHRWQNEPGWAQEVEAWAESLATENES